MSKSNKSTKKRPGRGHTALFALAGVEALKRPAPAPEPPSGVDVPASPELQQRISDALTDMSDAKWLEQVGDEWLQDEDGRHIADEIREPGGDD